MNVKWNQVPGQYKCVKCLTSKPVAEFNERKPGMTRNYKILWCRTCLVTHKKRVDVSEASGKQFKSKRDLIYCMKNRPCTDCGFQFHVTAMEFDHVRGEKVFSLAAPAGQAYEAVREEIAKCEVVCSNCHRVRTANRLARPGTPKISFKPICSFAGKVVFK